MSGSRASILGIALAFAVAAAVAASPRAGAEEVIHLAPEDKAAWSPGKLFSWLRPGHNFGERRIRVETTPPGAMLDLFYVRANFQKAYEQAQAPVTVVLPKRVEATGRDSVTIRAFLEGYRQKEVNVRVHDDRDHVLLELEPLPNTLRSVSLVGFGGRTALSLLTEVPAEVRIQKARSGFRVILNETALGPGVAEVLQGLRGPGIAGVEAHQVGNDLLVSVDLVDPEGEPPVLRQRIGRDPVRDLDVFTVDMLPADGGAASVEAARAALQRIRPEDVTGCALAFEDALRAELDPSELSRALVPRGAFTDPYYRAAMRRLGELSPAGVVAMAGGARYHTAVPLELSAALSDAAAARGYLAILRAWVRELEPPEARDFALRSLIAPEMPPEDFTRALARAREAEARCRSGSP